MRTEKTILRKVEEWQNNARLIPGVYRLFTYIKWESIPDKYKEFFPKDAKDTWNDDLKDFKEEHVRLDIDAEIKAVFRGLFGKKIMQSLSIMPIILADMYVIGTPVAKAQAMLNKITDNYIEYTSVDIKLAEANAIFEITELLTYIIKVTKLKTNFKPEDILNKIIIENKLDNLTNELPADIYAQVDAALLAYDLAKKEEEVE